MVIPFYNAARQGIVLFLIPETEGQLAGLILNNIWQQGVRSHKNPLAWAGSRTVRKYDVSA